MRKFHTVVSFAIMIAVMLVVLGLFRHYRGARTAGNFPASISLHAETAGRMFPCI